MLVGSPDPTREVDIQIYVFRQVRGPGGHIKKLEALGFERVDFREKAEVYVINTCTITGNATGFAYRGAKPELL